MFKVRFRSRRRTRDSSDSRESRQKRFFILGILMGLLLAVTFGIVLYFVNVSGRI